MRPQVASCPIGRAIGQRADYYTEFAMFSTPELVQLVSFHQDQPTTYQHTKLLWGPFFLLAGVEHWVNACRVRKQEFVCNIAHTSMDMKWCVVFALELDMCTKTKGVEKVRLHL